LAGVGAIVGSSATIGANSLASRGAVLPQGVVVPPRSLVAGVPAKVRRELSEDEINVASVNAPAYEYLIDVHREAIPVSSAE